MKLRYALLAERVRSNARGQFIIDGTADVARVVGDPPYHMPPVYVAGALVANPPADLVHRLEIVVPNPVGGELFRDVRLPRLTLEELGEGATLKYLAYFGVMVPPLELPGVGTYDFQILVDGALLGSVPLYVVPDRQSRARVQASPTRQHALGTSDDGSIKSILRLTRDTLRNAEIALDQLCRDADPERKIAAFSNVIVWGRAVTNVLQNLRSQVATFDEWYQLWVDEMRRDPLLRYLYEWRSKILKKGTPPPTAEELDLRRMLPNLRLPPAPANALSFFMGDETGGVGWLVRLPDGSVGKVYLTIPQTVAPNVLALIDLPVIHLGSPIAERTAEHVAELYVHYLERLVHTAERKFGDVGDA